MSPVIHCLTGLSGAGKTTLRRELEAGGVKTFGKDGGDREKFFASLVEQVNTTSERHLVVELNTGRRSWTIRQLKAAGHDVRVYCLDLSEADLRRNREARRAGRRLPPVRVDLSETYERTRTRQLKVAERWKAFVGSYDEIKMRLKEAMNGDGR